MRSTFNLAICLIVKTKQPIEFISKIMGVSPSGSIREGESKYDFIENADDNIWILHKRYKEQTDIDTCLQDYIEHIPEITRKVYEVKSYASCMLRISIVSIYGQISFSLSSSDLQLLSQLNIPLEVSIFSCGNCIDD